MLGRLMKGARVVPVSRSLRARPSPRPPADDEPEARWGPLVVPACPVCGGASGGARPQWTLGNAFRLAIGVAAVFAAIPYAPRSVWVCRRDAAHRFRASPA